MSILLAGDMLGIHLILGILHQRYIWQHHDALTSPHIREVTMKRNIHYMIALWFFLSVLVPTSHRFLFWSGMAPIIPIYRIGMAHRAS